jgi:hypothetical protein
MNAQISMIYAMNKWGKPVIFRDEEERMLYESGWGAVQLISKSEYEEKLAREEFLSRHMQDNKAPLL